MTTAEEYAKMSDAEKKKEDWMNAKWRPMMGWMYMVVCTMDFVIFPILWNLLQAFTKVAQITQWDPLTLRGAGLFHIAMGAVLGLAAFGRTQEKIAGANNGGAAPPIQPTAFSLPPAAPTPVASPGFGSLGPSAGSSFGTSSFGSAPATPTAPAAFGTSGKLGPAPAAFPEL